EDQRRKKETRRAVLVVVDEAERLLLLLAGRLPRLGTRLEPLHVIDESAERRLGLLQEPVLVDDEVGAIGERARVAALIGREDRERRPAHFRDDASIGSQP